MAKARKTPAPPKKAATTKKKAAKKSVKRKPRTAKPAAVTGREKGYANITPHQFQPGQSGNPDGRPRKIYTILKEKGYSKDDIMTAFHELAWYSVAELKAIFEKPATPAIVKTIAMAFKKSIESGDLSMIRQVLEYTLGKPKQRLEHTGEDGGPITIEDNTDIDYSKLSDEALMEILQATRKKSLDEDSDENEAGD